MSWARGLTVAAIAAIGAPAAAGAVEGPGTPLVHATAGGRTVSVAPSYPGCQPRPGGDPAHWVCDDSPGVAAASSRLRVRPGETIDLRFDEAVSGLGGHLRTRSLRRTTPQIAGRPGAAPDHWTFVVPRRGFKGRRELVLVGTLADGRRPSWLILLERRRGCGR